jgi:hypothetical protein
MWKMDESVLRLFEGKVFTPRYRRVMRLSDGNPDDGRSRLDAERARLQASVDALVTAIKVGGDIPALVGELKTCNDKLGVLDRQIESLPPAPPDRARASGRARTAGGRLERAATLGPQRSAVRP